jgi:hypothetical protein
MAAGESNRAPPYFPLQIPIPLASGPLRGRFPARYTNRPLRRVIGQATRRRRSLLVRAIGSGRAYRSGVTKAHRRAS